MPAPQTHNCSVCHSCHDRLFFVTLQLHAPQGNLCGGDQCAITSLPNQTTR